MPIKAIVFDFDGVILESVSVKTDTFRNLFLELFPEKPDAVEKLIDYHTRNMGISRFDKFRHFYLDILQETYTDELQDELGKRFSEIVYEQLLKVPFVGGAKEFLEDEHKNYLLFVASGSEENELKQVARERGVEKFFIEMHGGHRKKYDIISELLDKYNLTINEVVFVGDAESDLKAAKVLGLPYFVARIDSNDSPLINEPYRINDLTELNETIGMMG